MLKGVMHIHSTYSDGELTLRDLREQLVSAGCSFACIADHAEAFDTEKLGRYAKECELLSDERFLFIPGLEYECERRMHILGYGLLKRIGTRNPQEVIREIERLGGISVIAHPKDEMFSWIESFDTLPRGLEAWNTKYDGQYAPRASTFQLLERLQQRSPGLLAFYGQDFHWKRQYNEMFTWVWEDSIERGAIVESLRSGKYHAVKAEIKLPANGKITDEQAARFDAVHRRSLHIQRFFQNAKKAADGIGLKVPKFIKSRLRGIF